MTTHSLSPADITLLMRARARVTLTAFGPGDHDTCTRLSHEGLLKDEGGYRYTITAQGEQAIDARPVIVTLLQEAAPPRVSSLDRQSAILTFITRYTAEKGRSPNIREIGEATGITSTSMVSIYLNKLVEAGHLQRANKISRGMRIVPAATTDPLLITEDIMAVYRRYVTALEEAESFNSIVYPREMEHFQIDMWQAVLRAIDPSRWGG